MASQASAARLYCRCGGFLTFDQSMFTHMRGMGTPVEVPTLVVLIYVLVSMYGATLVAWIGASLLAARNTLMPLPFAAGVLKLVVLTLR